MPRSRHDLTGCTFGRLLVVHWVGVRGQGHHYWLCQCACGNSAEVATSNLRGGQQSCGCLKREALAARNVRHGWRPRDGVKVHPLYNAWQGLHNRCQNPNTAKYPNYGGRGISVCDRWSGRDGFMNFVADMGPKTSPGLSIDRIDVDGNYEPDNCRWATATEQARNRRPRATVASLRAQISELASEIAEYRKLYGPLEE